MSILYTVYWLDGKKSHLLGDSIEEAFQKAGYGLEAVFAADFYEEGKDTYWYSNKKKNWIPMGTMTIFQPDLATLTVNELSEILKTCNTINVIYDDGNILRLCNTYIHRYSEELKEKDWIKVYYVCYGENFETSDGEVSFTEINPNFFPNDKQESAINCFLSRAFNNDPRVINNHEDSELLERIKNVPN